MKTHRLAIAVLAAAFSAAANATPTAAPVRAEIDALLNKLQSSGCQFNRNGSWYSGAEAKSHLLRKLEYFEDKGSVKNTEQFIELAASKSSSSGKPYQVKCGNAAAMPSQQWLNAELSAIRGR
ncbi:YfeK family protein [Pseudoduganella ginsengisoli]|uniref:DUF5329 domain-containing protein n=1 Tax=Pseudoduganella ginsengisoli TaxID=1462440 RepID=A0A6L6PYB2_9BURK|nr:DUF5329 domain-containing protein [Pseudoduganella ginsengisoli]MTW01928.1 hypothetical protein [Pseudoduganella ginsengisoli]